MFIGGAVVPGCGGSIHPEQSPAEALRAQILQTRPAPLTQLDIKVRLNISDFGAVPNDRKDDRAAVVAAIEKASSLDGPVQIDFDPGVYDFMPVTPDFSVDISNAAIPVVKRGNLIVDGHGAEILIHRQDVVFAWMQVSTNIIIRNFSVDYDPLPFSQGSVVAVDPADSSFVFELHPGFPTPDDPFFKSTSSWGMLKDTKHPGRLKTDCPSFFMYSDILSLGDNRFRIALANKKEISNFEIGDVFVVNGRSASVGQYFNSENITFDGLTIYASPSCLFLGSGTSLLNVLNCKGLLKGNRLITTGADGVHCQAAPIGPWIENCEFEGLSDDCLNIYGLPIFIFSQSSPTEMKVYARAPIKPGDNLVFFNPKSGGIMLETTVVSFSGNTLVLKDPVGTLNIAPLGTPMKERDWKIYDHAYNLNTIGNGFVYRNNYMHDGRRYGVFIKASNGLIENNRFEGLSCNAFEISNEPDWPEGFWARNLVIQNNRISECGYGAKYPPAVIAGKKLRGITETPIQKNIFLLNNTFNAISGPALTLSGVAGLVAEGNVFASGSESGPLVTIQYSENIKLKDNEGQDRIGLQHMNATGVELNEK
ncbi:MAG: right-handed parallel beta-helix repeat-containing protein [Kiritimatiellales bacterium]|nr:right-handed parallel beta-helix repeat-containing protein [Kiritimatiellales bacterium]MCF7863438.1 right-handed parallel beta-helix repeat-containing protein [Kiritimatiellales bacterium]